MSKVIKENDVGDRMMTGLPYGTSGVVNPGVATPSSPDVSQSPNSFVDGSSKTIPPKPPGEITKSDIDKLKTTVTADEIIAGIRYEMKRMVNPDKYQAKTIVITNLKKDPKYYSQLHMLTQGDLRVNEESKLEESKKLTDEDKKKAFEEIFSGIQLKHNFLKTRQVDAKVVDAYKMVVNKVNSKRRIL